MVEDIVSTGVSSRECIAAIRATGAKVVAACCLIDRSGGNGQSGRAADRAGGMESAGLAGRQAAAASAQYSGRQARKPGTGMEPERCASASISTMSPRCGTRAAAASRSRARGETRGSRRAPTASPRICAKTAGISPTTISTRLTREIDIAAQSGNGRHRRDAGDRAQGHRPHAACIVPEKREERTTEGGIDAAGQFTTASSRLCGCSREAGIRVSLFIEPDRTPARRRASRWARRWWNLHTGAYCNAARERRAKRCLAQSATRRALRRRSLGLEIHAGHGLDFRQCRAHRRHSAKSANSISAIS